MDQLKLKYLISLVSDLGPKAKSDQEALTRAQQAIQREIGKTNQQLGVMERALGSVGRAGSASADRQTAYLGRLAMRYQDVRRAAEGAVSAMGKVAQVGAAGAAGVAAGAYAADRVTRAPMDYSLRLAHMANTAFADRDAAGRVAGKGVLDAAIRAAVRTGGGKIDDAAGALDALIASGAVSREQAIQMLPMLMRGSTASGTSAEQLGVIGLRGMQSFGLSVDQVPEVLNMAMAAGQAGGFELKDMAKWLPQAMAMGKQSGLSGMEGMRRILASMQASVITAGTKDEAGNNLVNLLGKINSADTAKDFQKLGYDLPSELARMRSKGVNSLDAFVSFVDELASKDHQYTALKAKLAQAGTKSERAEVLSSMADILQGKAVGKVVQDRQAMMALVAEMNNRGYVRDVMQRTRSDTTAIGTAFDVISGEAGFKKQQIGNEVMLAGQEAFNKVAPAMNRVLETSTDLAREFPLLTTGVVGATGALAVFAAALGGGSLVGLLKGRAATGAAGAAAASATEKLVWPTLSGAGATAAGAAASKAGMLTSLGRLGGPLALMAQGLFFTSDADMKVLNDAEAMRHSRGYGYNDPRLLSLTAPPGGSASGADAAAAVSRNALGQGVLDVNVRVTDDRITATTSVAQPMNQVRINAGNTNPAGYAR